MRPPTPSTLLSAGLFLVILPTLLGGMVHAADYSSGTITTTGGIDVTDGLDVVDANGTSLSQASATVAVGSVAAASTGTVGVFRGDRRLKISIGEGTTNTGTITMAIQFDSLCSGCTSNNEWRLTTNPVVSMEAGGTATTGRSTGSGNTTNSTNYWADQFNTSLCNGHQQGAGYSVLSSAMNIHFVKRYSAGCITHLLSGVTLKHFVPNNQSNGAYETVVKFTLTVS